MKQVNKCSIGATVNISVCKLYQEIGRKLTYGNIESQEWAEDSFYYDLLNQNDRLACMDGEECEIVDVDDSVITLVNRQGVDDVIFKLAKQEFFTAAFQ